MEKKQTKSTNPNVAYIHGLIITAMLHNKIIVTTECCFNVGGIFL